MHKNVHSQNQGKKVKYLVIKYFRAFENEEAKHDVPFGIIHVSTGSEL